MKVIKMKNPYPFFHSKDEKIVRKSSKEDITSFRGEYAFLSNFYPCEVKYRDSIVSQWEMFPTVEHAYQWAKTFNPCHRRLIKEAATPGAAKKIGKHVLLRGDWEKVKVKIMFNLLVSKFKHKKLRSKLLATGDVKIIEGNTWGDKIWGCVEENGKWVGKNYLGKLLMQLRDRIRRED